MAYLMDITRETYRYIFDDLVDHRSDGWFLMSSPWPTIAIVAFYIYFCTSLGPQLMKNKKPFNLDAVINVYNLFQVMACLYLFKRSCDFMFSGRYKIICEPVNYSNDHDAVELAGVVWQYQMLKLLDLFDTVFFVLRKKQNQVSVLHLYHHSFQVVLSWIWTKYLPGGHGTVQGFFNNFVHIFMYGYYFLTLMWPKYRRNLWWKKYLTQLQMIQLLLILFHSVPPFFMEKCDYPMTPICFIVIQAAAYFSLFSNFYYRTYCVTKKNN